MQTDKELPPSILTGKTSSKKVSASLKKNPKIFRRANYKNENFPILPRLFDTSGTTGDPKGARCLPHQQIVSEVEDVARAFPISSEDSTLSFLPYAHVLGRVNSG